MIPAMAQAIAEDLKVGKRVVIVVATPEDAHQYWLAVQRFGGRSGQVCVLCANAQNSSSWKTSRFDSMHVDDAALKYPGAEHLVHEARVRTMQIRTETKLERRLRRKKERDLGIR